MEKSGVSGIGYRILITIFIPDGFNTIENGEKTDTTLESASIGVPF